MPPGGAAARARQMALLKTIAHERFVDAEVGRLLERAEREVAHLPDDAFEAAYVRVARRDFDRAVATPAAFTRRFFAHTAATYQAWTEARPADDWTGMVPLLETTLDLSRELSSYEGPGAEHPADPLIARSDHGMTVATLRPLFAQLREALVPLVRAATEPEPRRRRVPAPSDPRGGPGRLRPRARRGVRLRPAAGAHRSHRPPFRDRVQRRRRADHDPQPDRRPARDALHHLPRERPWDVPPGTRSAVRGDAAGRWRLGGGPREPIAPVGERGRPQPRLLARRLRRPAGGVARHAAGRATGRLRGGHQRRPALPHPHRRRRADVQPARHRPLRARAGAAGGTAGGARPGRGVACGLRRDPRRRGGERPRRRAARRPLVLARDRRRVPGLHDRQRAQRAVLRGRVPSAPRDPGRDRGRPVRDVVRLDARERASPRPRVRSGRPDRARDRWPARRGAVPGLPARQVRGRARPDDGAIALRDRPGPDASAAQSNANGSNGRPEASATASTKVRVLWGVR